MLFIIALERLSHSIQDAVNNGIWCPLKFGRGGPSVSHLLFADDILLITKALLSNAQVLVDILERFGSCSGQTINRAKSSVLFSPNTPPGVAAAISSLLGIPEAHNLGRYLGNPIISGCKGRADFSFLIDKVRSKLSRWKASTLSQAGRISLTQSCIFSIPNYVMQACKIPTSFCDEIEKMCRDFIWGSTPEARKNHLIAWEKLCSPKEDGGLGFSSLRMVNDVYMMKLGWGLISKKNALWSQVLRFKYGCGNRSIPTIKCSSRASHHWRGICQLWPFVENGILWIIKSGHDVRFWDDPWVPDLGVLSDHALLPIPEMERNLTVMHFFEHGLWNWPLLCQVLPIIVCHKIASICLPDGSLEDFPIWKCANDGIFSLRSAFEVLFDTSVRSTPEFDFPAVWKLRTPQRINTFLWEVAHHRLMTNLECSTRGITNSALCPRCNLYPESILHLLRDCEIILELWEQIVDPSVWHLFVSLGLERWLEFNLRHQQMDASSLHWPIMFATMIHMLWIDKNHYVFSGKSALLAVFLPKVLGQVTAIHLYLTKPTPYFIDAIRDIDVCWIPPPPGWYVEIKY